MGRLQQPNPRTPNPNFGSAATAQPSTRTLGRLQQPNPQAPNPNSPKFSQNFRVGCNSPGPIVRVGCNSPGLTYHSGWLQQHHIQKIPPSNPQIQDPNLNLRLAATAGSPQVPRKPMAVSAVTIRGGQQQARRLPIHACQPHRGVLGFRIFRFSTGSRTSGLGLGPLVVSEPTRALGRLQQPHKILEVCQLFSEACSGYFPFGVPPCPGPRDPKM